MNGRRIKRVVLLQSKEVYLYTFNPQEKQEKPTGYKNIPVVTLIIT